MILATLTIGLIPFLFQEAGGTGVDTSLPEFCEPAGYIPLPNPLYPCLPPFYLSPGCVDRCIDLYEEAVMRARFNACDAWLLVLAEWQENNLIIDLLDADCGGAPDCASIVLEVRMLNNAAFNAAVDSINSTYDQEISDAELFFQLCLEICCKPKISDPPEDF